MKLIIATRKSPLALWQTRFAAAAIEAACPGVATELLPLSTRGDEVLDRSLARIGGKGLFLKELEQAMFDGRAHLAVHSMKDVPVDMPEGMTIAAVMRRHDPRDALIARSDAGSLADLPQGAIVGTSSLRRQLQLLAQRPDLRMADLRGNIQTRLGKLDAGQYDAIVLAKAGLARMEIDRGAALPVTESLPAVAQGAIGLECLEDSEVAAMMASLDDEKTRREVEAERAVSRALGGSCQAPIAVHATTTDRFMTLRAMVGRLDPLERLSAQARGNADQWSNHAADVADQLQNAGALAMIRSCETSEGGAHA